MKKLKERRCRECGKVLSEMNRHPDLCYSHQPMTYQAFPKPPLRKDDMEEGRDVREK